MTRYVVTVELADQPTDELISAFRKRATPAEITASRDGCRVALSLRAPDLGAATKAGLNVVGVDLEVLSVHTMTQEERERRMDQDPSLGDWLTVKQAAATAGVSVQRIHQLVNDPGGPRVESMRATGKTVLIDSGSLHKWMQERRGRAGAGPDQG